MNQNKFHEIYQTGVLYFPAVVNDHFPNTTYFFPDIAFVFQDLKFLREEAVLLDNTLEYSNDTGNNNY